MSVVNQRVLDTANRAYQNTLSKISDNNNPETLDPTNFMYNDAGNYRDVISDPILRAYLIQMDTANTRDRQIEAQQQFTEYLLGEQNYRRSLEDRDYHSEGNQLARLMASGMSRTAALQALTGASSAQSQSGITPMASHGTADFAQMIGTSVQGVTQLAQLASQLYSLPFDIQTKRLTNRVLSTQSYMLDSQRTGLDAAAAFSEAVANANAMGANLSQMSLQEQYDYFITQASLNPGDDGYNAPAAAYGVDLQRSGALSNPFFWSSLSGMRSGVAQSDASLYEPERLRSIIQQQHAASVLAEEQSKVFSPQVRILNSDAFVAEMTQDLKVKMQQYENTIASVNASSAQSISDAAVAEANYQKAYFEDMLGILPTITSATLEEYSFRLHYLETIHDPAYFESERNKLVSTNEYDAVVYTKLKMIESFKSNELGDMFSGADPDKLAQYRSMVREGTALIDLYGSAINDEKHKWIRDISTGLGIGVAGYAAFGSKGKPAPRSGGYTVSTGGSSIYNYTTPM